ncbi:ribonuclease P 40kDa subunit-domain-containing protein [Ampelomyces quisqualis]|uniref:Ribonuclease P 40kDa subunit-domain-containing protein n=1 Tax=Ampelomyces quisqualis TaxID=50730 RepID=A0A6A5QAI1_AMPQU|nr:ribonuclease P 40kDa subunit-domain-containing protein [Ampelomyces quisqualis]
MLDIHRTDTTSNPKIYFTHSILPSYIDPQNVSTKKQPFATFNKQPFSHILDLILPAEMYELIQQSLSTFATSHYARVDMKLGEILEPDFLAAYIKQGNITMLSEGRPLIDNRFQLHDGILRLELDRQTYERCGLQGTPIEDGGKKHQKSRWIITYNLRQRSMKHGKSAFSRLEWACKNVLDRSLTWVFWNANPSSSEALTHASEVLSKHAPHFHEIAPTTIRLEECLCPKLAPDAAMFDEDESLRLLEYIHILSLPSPRVNANDAIDPHLSRYAVPDFGAGVARRGFVCVRWKGFMPPAFVRDVFLSARRDGFRSNKAAKTTQQDADMNVDVEADKEQGMWFALIAQGFGAKTSWTTMQFERGHTLTWATEN